MFMGQCGGIGVLELNKLELELCERLQWRLLPTVADMRELLDAMHSPQASFWDAWRNAPRTAPAVNAGAGRSVCGAEGREDASHSARLPHAKSVQHSLARFFSGSNNVGSEGNLEALAAAATAKLTAGAKGGVGMAFAGADTLSPSSGSPRSVMNGRTFSLSNLFGLASGW